MAIKNRVILFLFLTMAITLTGCGKKEVEEPVYELKGYSANELQNNTYYIKSGEVYYPVASGTMLHEDRGSAIAKEVSDERIVWYADDDCTIPTMYQEDSLIYVTDSTVPNNFIWERYEDLGYTIGICKLAANDSGRYTFVKSSANTLQPISDAFTAFANITDDTIVNIDKVDNMEITADNISRAGTITGLTYGKVYTVDAYLGTNYEAMEIEADTHAFVSYELYETAEYSLSQSGYAALVIPQYFKSGYYYINGAGMIKYVANSRLDGIQNIDFNDPYYLGYDENGHMVTADEVTSETLDEDDNENSFEAVWNQTYTLDCSQEKMTITITYSDVINLLDGELISLESDEEAEIPSATMTGPDGKEYVFETDERLTNAISCTVESPLTGEWAIKIKGCTDRTFDTEVVLVSGHSDNLVHSGSGSAYMTVYLPENLADGIFMFNWDNVERAADIVIETPDGKKYGKSVNETDLIDEGYGYLNVAMGECSLGDYKITVTGEDLGRVRWSYMEKASDTTVETTETTTENTDNPIITGTVSQ